MSTKTIGDLRHRIRIDQEGAPTIDEIGGQTQTWTALSVGSADGLLWANVAPMSAGEQWRRQQMNASANWKVTLRYRSDVTTKMRVVWDGRTFEVRGVTNPDMQKRFLELTCEEIVAP